MVLRADDGPGNEQTGQVANAVPNRVLSVDEATTRLTTPTADLDIDNRLTLPRYDTNDFPR